MTFNYAGRRVATSAASKAMNCAALKGRMDICMAAHPRFFNQYENRSEDGSFEFAFRAIPKERVKLLLADSSVPARQQEQIAFGYMTALKNINNNFSTMSFCEKDIVMLYRELTDAHSEPTDALYRKDESAIEMTVNGKKLPPITPISSDKIADSMSQMYAAYKAAEDDKSINDLFIVPYVIIDFLSASPFRSENLKMALLITYLLLRKCGYDVVRYVPFEENATAYLEKVHSHLQVHISDWDNDNGNGRYQGFSKLFYEALAACYTDIYTQYIKKYGELTAKKPDKPAPKAEMVKRKIAAHKKPFSKSDMLKELINDVSPDTIESVIREMVKSGELVKTGSGKKTLYAKPEPVHKAVVTADKQVNVAEKQAQAPVPPKPTNASPQQSVAPKPVQQNASAQQKSPTQNSINFGTPTSTQTNAQTPSRPQTQAPVQPKPTNAAAPQQSVAQKPTQQNVSAQQKPLSPQTNVNPGTPTSAQTNPQASSRPQTQAPVQPKPTNASPQQSVAPKPVQQNAPAQQKSPTQNSIKFGTPTTAQANPQIPSQLQVQTTAKQHSGSPSSASYAELVETLVNTARTDEEPWQEVERMASSRP